eukprot:6852885-Alexandrium_andersonii.AAC.1
MRCARPVSGASLWSQVLGKVGATTGDRWSEADVKRMWNYCLNAGPQKLRFLQAFSRFVNDSKEFRATDLVLPGGGRRAVQVPG